MIDARNITKAERADLLQKLKELEQEELDNKRKERDNYRELVEKTVAENIVKLDRKSVV